MGPLFLQLYIQICASQFLLSKTQQLNRNMNPHQMGPPFLQLYIQIGASQFHSLSAQSLLELNWSNNFKI